MIFGFWFCVIVRVLLIELDDSFKDVAIKRTFMTTALNCMILFTSIFSPWYLILVVLYSHFPLISTRFYSFSHFALIIGHLDVYFISLLPFLPLCLLFVCFVSLNFFLPQHITPFCSFIQLHSWPYYSVLHYLYCCVSRLSYFLRCLGVADWTWRILLRKLP